MLKCGSCGSGVTPEEKFKRLCDGSVKRYVYYHCNRFKDMSRKEAYIREETLVEELLKVIDKIDIDKIGTIDKLKREIERFQKFNNTILKINNPDKIKTPEVDVKEYAKYLLQEGTRDEKREILNYLKTELHLKNQKVYLKKRKNS